MMPEKLQNVQIVVLDLSNVGLATSNIKIHTMFNQLIIFALLFCIDHNEIGVEMYRQSCLLTGISYHLSLIQVLISIVKKIMLNGPSIIIVSTT